MKIRHIFAAAFFLIASLNGTYAFATAGNATCATMLKEIVPMAMKMPYWEFDQSDAGWRKLASCPAEKTQLLDLYVKKQESDLRNVRWHLAQSLALSGENHRASVEAIKSLNPDETNQHPDFSWNTYVQATVEFLRNDRAAFDIQYDALQVAAVKNPRDRINLTVLVGLAKCFGKPYREAYTICRGGS